MPSVPPLDASLTTRGCPPPKKKKIPKTGSELEGSKNEKRGTITEKGRRQWGWKRVKPIDDPSSIFFLWEGI
jgi:hypothetical protein